MSFASVLGHFPKWFHIFGQNTFTLATNQMQIIRNRGAVKFIPTGVLLLLATIAAILLCVNANSISEYAILNSFSKIANAQLSILLTFDLATVFVVTIQAFFPSSHYLDLYTRIHFIERLSQLKFSWNFNRLRRTLVRQMCTVCVAFSLPYLVIFILKPITRGFVIIMSCDCSLAVCKLITYFHVLFFIQLLNHMLQAFVKFVEFRVATLSTTHLTLVINRDGIAQMSLEMHYFKLLHFNLWQLCHAINHVFGWVLLIHFLDHFLYIIYISFQTCIIFLDRSNPIEILREFL